MSIEDKIKKVNEALQNFTACRDNTISSLKCIADTLDNHHVNISAAKQVGATAGLIGGMMWFSGIVGAPFTGGGSLVMVGVGQMVLGVGGATTLGASATEQYIAYSKATTIKATLEADSEASKYLVDEIQQLQKFLNACTDVCGASPETLLTLGLNLTETGLLCSGFQLLNDGVKLGQLCEKGCFITCDKRILEPSNVIFKNECGQMVYYEKQQLGVETSKSPVRKLSDLSACEYKDWNN